MPPKKKLEQYKKLVSKKLAEAGVQDKIGYKVSKRKMIRNVAYGTIKDEKGELAKDQGPQYFEIRSEQAVNMHRSLLKKVLSLPEQAIKAFLAAKLEIEEAAEPKAPEEPKVDIVGAVPPAPAEAAVEQQG